MKNVKTYIGSFKLGEKDGESILLSSPSWDCGWYWGYGYLGNKNCHYRLDGLNKDKNLYDAIKEHFGDTLTITDDEDLWQFSELMASFYSLKETAKVLGRGGLHYTTNVVSDVIMNKTEAKRINEIVMPAIFEAISQILKKY